MAIVPQQTISGYEVQVTDVETVKNLALREIEQLKELKEKQKLLNEEKQSILDNDTELSRKESDIQPVVDEIKKIKKTIKASEQFMAIESKAKDLKEDIDMVKDSLSNALINYTKLTGSNFIEDATGKQYKIKHKLSVSSGQLKLF